MCVARYSGLGPALEHPRSLNHRYVHGPTPRADSTGHASTARGSSLAPTRGTAVGGRHAAGQDAVGSDARACRGSSIDA